jgi:hypothetical protein
MKNGALADTVAPNQSGAARPEGKVEIGEKSTPVRRGKAETGKNDRSWHV